MAVIAGMAITISVVQAADYKVISKSEINAFYKNLPFEMPVVKTRNSKKQGKLYDFGACGDGLTLNTEAIRQGHKSSGCQRWWHCCGS